MKIAIVGANGFIGLRLFNHLKNKYDTTPITRQTLDLLDYNIVKDYLKKHKFDVIINAAAKMTTRENLEDLRNNLTIFYNFFNNSDHFKMFIDTGSGAELDRTKNINLVDEDDIFKRLPSDSYGLGQNLKSRAVREKDNFFTVRIFNCFGKGELETRIFPKILNSTDFNLFNDRYFDFFYIEDLFLVTEFYLHNKPVFKDINLVYNEKFKISEVINKFINYKNLNCKMKIQSTSDLHYTGNGSKLSSLALPLLGLEYGLKNYS